ncbi:hypothetical protein E3N88_14542 [Mikania micrantha]|uniref:Ycf2 N-terminal domain-containing protein n=1 Tax=Mikania micrantha TaxID=192012 RepID=A0A5N6P202_9ASTR|nr:hypothetical protein E3N88_14542 [Mikania micrantha]
MMMPEINVKWRPFFCVSGSWRSLESISKDIATSIGAGMIPRAIVKIYLELEKLRVLLTLPGVDMPRILLKERGAFGNGDTGSRWWTDWIGKKSDSSCKISNETVAGIETLLHSNYYTTSDCCVKFLLSY